jgi:hypothetical protein
MFSCIIEENFVEIRELKKIQPIFLNMFFLKLRIMVFGTILTKRKNTSITKIKPKDYKPRILKNHA